MSGRSWEAEASALLGLFFILLFAVGMVSGFIPHVMSEALGTTIGAVRVLAEENSR